MTSQEKFDLLLKGGTLLDPAQDIYGRRDVAFQNGRVASVAEAIPSAMAKEVEDVAGGKLRAEVVDAARRGVVLDVGQSTAHCDLEVATGAIQQGLAPTTISTDISYPRPGRYVCLMNELVSRFHAMGMSLRDTVAASTWRPAHALGLEKDLGALAPGMAGDAAVFTLQEGRFVWRDAAEHTVQGKVRLDTFLTVRDGGVVWKECV